MQALPLINAESGGFLGTPRLPPKQKKMPAFPVRSGSEQSLRGRVRVEQAAGEDSDQMERVKAKRAMSKTLGFRPPAIDIQMLPLKDEVSPPLPQLSLLSPPPSGRKLFGREDESSEEDLRVLTICEEEEKSATLVVENTSPVQEGRSPFKRKKYPFLRYYMFFCHNSRKWTLADCEKHAPSIAAFYAVELSARSIPFVAGSLESPRIWESLERQLKEFDGPDLGKIMAVLIPKLKKMGHFIGEDPDMWEALWYLLCTTDAVKKVTELVVEGVELAKIPFCFAWMNWPNLVDISFAGNKIKKFPLTFLVRCPRVRSLCLCRNFIEKIPADLLTIMADLSVLDLSGNRITALPPKLGVELHSSYRLVIVGLQNNNITELSEEELWKLGAVEQVQYTLDFSGNVIPPGKMPKETPKNVFLIHKSVWRADPLEGKKDE